VIALILSAKAIARIAAGIYAALVVIARIANPSTINALGVLEFVLPNYSGGWIVSVISDDLTTASLAH
jgi:hypothetical protein